jgi:hypothetical protein
MIIRVRFWFFAFGGWGLIIAFLVGCLRGALFLFAYGVGLFLICLPARRFFVCTPAAVASP